ncbi:MAG: ACT domain-containing protein, partial [Actinomycetota bacterium]
PVPAREISADIARLLAEREALREPVPADGGWRVVRAHSDAVDRAVVGVWDRVRPDDAACLVAVGGYGRRELSPGSDIDLMVLAGGGSVVAHAAEALFYELWDSGMQVGHSVRTLKEALAVARADLNAETAFLDARLLTGDKALFDRFAEEALVQTRRSKPPFRERIRAATEERHRRAGEAYGDLEPHLKDGRGGLRDYQTIQWLAVTGQRGRYDHDRLMKAVGNLHLVRTILHEVTGRHTDGLAVQWQAQVAEVLAGGDVDDDPGAEDRLMRLVYESCRTVAFALDAALDPGVVDALDVLPPELLEGHWTGEGLRAFLDLLAGGPDAVTGLRALDETGALLRMLPEWQTIRCLPQRNIYHRWPVDLHLFETVAALATFAPRPDGAQRAGPVRSRIFRRAAKDELVPGGDRTEEGDGADDLRPDWRDLTRRVAADAARHWDRLLVAALFHDVGKGTDEDHSVRGEQLARQATRRMRMPAVDVDEVAWLVRQHLTLTTTAVRRNIDDESLVVELAEAVGSVERLRLLYLLSVADGVATSPAAWTPWKATLVGDVFMRIYHLLDRGDLVSRQASLLARARSNELRAALASFPQEDVDRHLVAMPRAWLLSQSTRALVMQSRVMLRVAGNRSPHLEARLFAEPDVWEVMVVAPDRPGLFSKVAGVLALHGLNVLTAQIFTRSDGVGLEVFRVSGTGERFDRVAGDVDKALRGRLSLDLRLEEKRRQYASRIAKGARRPPSVRVDNQASDFYTVIEVHAADRVGLLYDITRALADLELDVHLAKIATYGEDVVDAFYVRDLEGQKVSDTEHVREIERTILHKLGA